MLGISRHALLDGPWFGIFMLVLIAVGVGLLVGKSIIDDRRGGWKSSHAREASLKRDAAEVDSVARGVEDGGDPSKRARIAFTCFLVTTGVLGILCGVLSAVEGNTKLAGCFVGAVIAGGLYVMIFGSLESSDGRVSRSSWDEPMGFGTVSAVALAFLLFVVFFAGNVMDLLGIETEFTRNLRLLIRTFG